MQNLLIYAGQKQDRAKSMNELGRTGCGGKEANMVNCEDQS